MNAQPKPLTPTYARETVASVWDEIQPLLCAHWQEIARYQDIPLAPDFERYVVNEQRGVLRIFTARSDGDLIGYAVYIVGHAPHYKGSKQAQQDVLYISPAHRRGRTGWKLIQYADEQLRAEGVQLVQQHVKNAHPGLGSLLERMGYEAVETIWMRRLD